MWFKHSNMHQKHRSTIWPARVLLYCEMHCVGDWHECAAPVIGDWGNGRGRIPLIRRCCKIRFWIMWQIWYLLCWSLWSEDAAKISILRVLLSFVICQGMQRYGSNDILLISRFGKIWSVLWLLRFDPHCHHYYNFHNIQKIVQALGVIVHQRNRYQLLWFRLMQTHKRDQDLQRDNGFFNCPLNHFAREPIKKNPSHTNVHSIGGSSRSLWLKIPLHMPAPPWMKTYRLSGSRLKWFSWVSWNNSGGTYGPHSRNVTCMPRTLFPHYGCSRQL